MQSHDKSTIADQLDTELAMENAAQATPTAGSSETLNGSELRGSFSEGLDQQRSLVKEKEAELKEMQDQVESYNQMIKQLASQRELAVKKLADMDRQIEELNRVLETERLHVEAKDKELKTKRTQLQTLKNEEDELTEKFRVYKQELNTTAENLSNTQLQETQVKTKIGELEQYLAMTNAAIDDIEKAVNIKDTIKLSALCNQMLSPPTLSIDNLTANVMRNNIDISPALEERTKLNDKSDQLFESLANFDPFADEDPFDGDDPFKSENTNLTLPDDDPFNPSANASSGFLLAQNDPFAPPALKKG